MKWNQKVGDKEPQTVERVLTDATAGTIRKLWSYGGANAKRLYAHLKTENQFIVLCKVCSKHRDTDDLLRAGCQTRNDGDIPYYIWKVEKTRTGKTKCNCWIKIQIFGASSALTIKWEGAIDILEETFFRSRNLVFKKLK